MLVWGKWESAPLIKGTLRKTSLKVAAPCFPEERKYQATFSPRRCHRPPPPAAAACSQRWRLPQHAAAACCSGARLGVARSLDIPLRMGSVSASGVLRGRGPWDGPLGELGGRVTNNHRRVSRNESTREGRRHAR